MVGDDGNGNGKVKLELERRDWIKVGGFVLLLVGTILGGIVPLSMYVFQTRAKTIAEHAAMDQAAALHAQEVALRREFSESRVLKVEVDAADTKQIVHTIHLNQQLMMRGKVPKREIKRLPASVDVDFGELGQ